MDYVDLFVMVAIVLVFAGFAWCFGIVWQNWKEDCARAGFLGSRKTVEPQNQQPRAVSWEEIDALKERVNKLEKWAWADHDHDQQMQSAINTLDRKIGKRFCIKWTEEFTSYNTTMEESFTRNFVWGDNYSMSEQEAWTTLEKIKKDSKDTFNLVLVTVEGRATLVTSRIHVRCGGQTKHTYFIEEVKI